MPGPLTGGILVADAARTGLRSMSVVGFLLVTWMLVVIAILLWGEFQHWRSPRRRMGTPPGRSGTGETILVLGYRKGEYAPTPSTGGGTCGVGAENLREQAIFVNHAPARVAPLDTELIQIRDAAAQLPCGRWVL